MSEGANNAGLLLEARAICKSFAGVSVLKSVDFDVQAGEVHALVGENGAGKSTLMNILAGVLQPDSGEIIFAGAHHRGFVSASAAQDLGIAMVFQERSLFGPLSVAENIFAGRQPVRHWGYIDQRQLREKAVSLLSQVAPDISPEAPVDSLTPSQQQMVEIAKALSLQARLIIFDEPTAALTIAETQKLFDVIRNLRSRQVGIIYISHRLEEVFQLADRITVLKDGVGQGTLKAAQATPEELIRRMVGRDLDIADQQLSQPGTVLLEVQNYSDPEGMPFGKLALKEISLKACAKEIVGLAGLAGAGRTELALTLFGARTCGTGQFTLMGRSYYPSSPATAIASGLGYLTEDRKEWGLFLEMSISQNIAASSLEDFGWLWYRDSKEHDVADGYRQQLRIASQHACQEVSRLSGGNQQKILLARWLHVQPGVLIVDEPTRGVDVGAKAELHQILRDYAKKGNAVIVISSELPELLSLSDRIYVMHSGCITGELPRHEATEETIMRLATLQLV